MRGRPVRVAALVAVVAVVAFTGFLLTRPVAQEATAVDSPLIGTAAPAVSAPTLAGGRVALASLRGRVVVVTFFASWCAPCRTEAPDLATFAYGAGARGAKTSLLGVVYNDSNDAAASFARTYGLTYPVLEDPGGTIASEFGVTGPPVTVVVSPTGRIASILNGAVTTSQLDHVTASARAAAAARA